MVDKQKRQITIKTTESETEMPKADWENQLFAPVFLRNLREFRDLHFLCDCLLRLEIILPLNTASFNGASAVLPLSPPEEIFAHRLVLAAGSNFFKEIFLVKKEQQKEVITTVNLKLPGPNAILAFKLILGYLYSGELHFCGCDISDVSSLISFSANKSS